jgi:seryl-tRNA synthetase
MMQSRTWDLARLGEGLFEQLANTVRANAPGGHVVVDEASRRLTVETCDDGVLATLDRFVQDMQSTHRRLPRKVLWEAPPPAGPGDVDAMIAASPDVTVLADGLIALRGRLLGLFRFFELEFRALAQAWGADENHYPVLLPIAVLEELQYFTNFPQQVTFCAHLPEDIPALEAASTGDGWRALVGPPGHALEPAVCLPCYPQNRGRVVPEEGFAVTMQNHVFRWEGTAFRSLARLWDFTVRDLVFFADYERLTRRRQRVMEATVALCEELGLGGRLELANDPFFLNASRQKSVYQRLGEVKYELVLAVPGRAGVAVSSFNLHRDFYTKVYDIRRSDGTRAETACMGFGLERWVYAFVAQKGLDVDAWPRRVAAHVEGT